MITELRQPLWMSTPYGEGLALLVTDYGPESDHLWTCVQQEEPYTGQLWTWHNSEVRVLANRSMLRGSAERKLSEEDLNRYKDAWHRGPAPVVTSESDVDRRADGVMEELWRKFYEYYCTASRAPGIGLAMSDQRAFMEIAQPLLRALARPPRTL